MGRSIGGGKGNMIDIIHAIAFALFEGDITPDQGSVQADLERWRRDWLPALEGPHHGSCVNIPTTCLRCMVEDYYRTAAEIVREFFVQDRQMRQAALEWRKVHGDPIDKLAELIDGIIGDDLAGWNACIEGET